MSTSDQNDSTDLPDLPEPLPEEQDPAAPLRAGLTYGLRGLGILLVAGLLIFWPWKGTPGLWGVLVGAAIGGGFILITVIAILLTAKASPSVVMGALMGSYVIKVAVVLVVMALIKDMDFYSKPALVSMLIGAIVAVLGSELWGVLTTRQLYVDPEAAKDR